MNISVIPFQNLDKANLGLFNIKARQIIPPPEHKGHNKFKYAITYDNLGNKKAHNLFFLSLTGHASIEYENDKFQHLGSVVTNNGYSDWATTEIPASIKSMWYRLSRRCDDFCIECSYDGINFKQMRVCHMFNVKETIKFGIYACSPEDSSFKAIFTNMLITECKWQAHNGQQPDVDC